MTAQKSTIRRWNGTDWDPIYLATTADIVALGKAANIEKLETAPFAYNDTLEINDNIADLLITIVNRMATLDTDVIPALAAGSGVTELGAEKITGIVARANLPEDIGGKGLEVADADAKAALTKTDVNIGDIVKVTGGGTYMVTGYAEETEAPTYMTLSDDASDVSWTRVKNTPTTLEGYGITDAVGTADTVDHGTATEDDDEDFSAAGKVVKTNADGKLDFDITGDAATLGGHNADYFAKAADHTELAGKVADNTTAIADINDELDNFDAGNIKTGMLDLKVIPKAALSEMHVVTNREAMASLTTEQVQQGDTVKIADQVDEGGNITKAGEMFYVADATKLGTEDWEDAFLPYTAAQASAVDWSGVLNKPTTLSGYGITDAVNSSLVSETAAAGKLLLLDANGKLPADITGDAATLGGHNADYFAKADDLTKVADDLADLTEAVLGTDGGEGDEPSKTLMERLTDLEDAVGDSETAGTILNDIVNLKSGSAITALAASKLTGTVSRANLPEDIGGRLVEKADMDAAMADLTVDDVAAGDLLRLDSGALYMIVDTTKLGEAAGYKLLVDVSNSDVAWTQIKDTPTTLNGYGITDAVNTNDVIVDGIPTEPAEGEDPVVVAGKLVKIAEDNKLHVNISGDAATVGGKSVDELTLKSDFDKLSLRVPVFLDKLEDAVDPKVGQVVLIPVEPNNILTNLDNGTNERVDHMAAAQAFQVTDLGTGKTTSVNPADIVMSDI